MPHRNLSYEAVVLRARESPGGDRIVTFLAADAGLVDAFVFGGPKNRLRSLASPYHAGIAWIYLDPVRDFRKLSDFDARQTYPSLRENLRKIWAASYYAEAALRTDAAGGESRAAYDLLREGLDALDNAEEAGIDGVSLQYGWRLLDLLGLRPDPEACPVCGAAFPESGGAVYSRAQGGFLCPSCLRTSGSAVRADSVAIGPAALRFLADSCGLSIRDALRSDPVQADLPALKAIVFHLVRGAAEGELRTLERGDFL